MKRSNSHLKMNDHELDEPAVGRDYATKKRTRTIAKYVGRIAPSPSGHLHSKFMQVSYVFDRLS